jgi:hypothetical protein
MFPEKMAELKQLDICIKVALKWRKCCGNFSSTLSSFGETTMQKGVLRSKRCKPLDI